MLTQTFFNERNQMMKYTLSRKMLIISIICLSPISSAQADKKLYVVDVYGTNEVTSKQIENKFKKELTVLATSGVGASLPAEKQAAFNKALNTINQSLQSTRNYTLFNIAPITFSNDSTCYITFDYIKTSDLAMLKQTWLPKPTQHIPDLSKLIYEWHKYFYLANDLIFAKKVKIEVKTCPAHHCMFGFDHPLLEKYKIIFDQAEKHKVNLVKIMREDSDGEKRAAVIFILGHIKNRDELIKLILPSLNDSNSSVRNNVLRTLIYLAQKDKNIHLPLDKIFYETGFPIVTERNKALYVISALADNPTNAKLIKHAIGKQLIDNLKLQQPSNHNPAYEVLKKISGKNYGERDYQAWEKYLRSF